VLLMLAWQRKAPAFFRGETLSKVTHEFVLAHEEGIDSGARLPDSHEALVIAPDLSNLPPGQHAVEVRTEGEIRRDEDERHHSGPS
jgi:hypothetical protein